MTTTFEKCLEEVHPQESTDVAYMVWLMLRMKEHNKNLGAARWKLVCFRGDSMDVLDCLHNKVVRFAVTVG